MKVLGKRRRSTPDHDGSEEEVHLVDQPGRQGLAGEFAGSSPDSPGFACMETMALATETIGFD